MPFFGWLYFSTVFYLNFLCHLGKEGVVGLWCRGVSYGLQKMFVWAFVWLRGVVWVVDSSIKFVVGVCGTGACRPFLWLAVSLLLGGSLLSSPSFCVCSGWFFHLIKFLGDGRSFSGAAPIGMNGFPLLIVFLIRVDFVFLAISSMGRIAV